MSWSIGRIENVTTTIPVEDKNGEKKFVRQNKKRLVLIHENLDSTRTNWIVSCRFKKKEQQFTYSIKYPESYQPIDKRGFHRPNGLKEIQNVETGLDGATFLRRLVEKFGKDFTLDVVVELNKLVKA